MKLALLLIGLGWNISALGSPSPTCSDLQYGEPRYLDFYRQVKPELKMLAPAEISVRKIYLRWVGEDGAPMLSTLERCQREPAQILTEPCQTAWAAVSEQLSLMAAWLSAYAGCDSEFGPQFLKFRARVDQLLTEMTKAFMRAEEDAYVGQARKEADEEFRRRTESTRQRLECARHAPQDVDLRRWLECPTGAR